MNEELNESLTTNWEAENWEAEFAAANRAACLFDISSRDEIRLTGEDRATFLHGFCTNDINKLQAGQSCEAFASSIQGKTLGHLFVFAYDNSLVIDTTCGAVETLLPHLDRYLITEDVTIENSSQQRALFFLTGPAAISSLGKIDADLEKLSINQHLQITLFGITVQCRRVDWFQQPGFQLSVEKSSGEQLQNHLSKLGVTLGGQFAWETLRVENGFPEFGIDFNSENLAQEINRTAIAISFTKGCYLGQEPIARIDALGHVNRLLRKITILDAEISPESLTRENSIATKESDKTLGQITSAAVLPSVEKEESKMIAIAIVNRKIAEPGTEVVVKTESGTYAAVIEANMNSR